MTKVRSEVWLLGLALATPGLASGGVESIRAERLRATVELLSSDRMAGRETGEPGIRRAEKLIAKEFQRIGLRPLPGRDDFFVDFTLYRQVHDESGTAVSVIAPERLDGKVGVDFRPFRFSDEGAIEAEVVFAGYGITAPEYGYDDYAGIDVEGKIVLILRHEPGEKDPGSSFDGTDSSSHATFASKARTAREHGAAAMLLVTDPLNHVPGDDFRVGRSLSLKPPKPRADEGETSDDTLLAVHISRKMADALVSSSGRSLGGMQQAIEDGIPASDLPLKGVSARVAVRRADDAEPVSARNVAAFLEGRDPALRREWILVGGHHDHVGGYAGEGDTVYNGADDNASGTSGVLALAEAFARRETAPRRSMAFVTFSAEEKGLLGSRAMVSQEQIPVEQVVFMLNLDMIGRNPDRKIEVYGDGYVRGLRDLVEEVNGNTGLDIEFGGAGYAGNSDHDSFYREDIPFLFFFTGVHEDYHQIGDHADKLSYERMGTILATAYGVLDRVAEADDPPVFVHHIGWLGAQIEVLGQDSPRAVITAVDADSRGERAGLVSGDVITGFGDARLDDPAQVGRRFREIDPGTTVALGIRRGTDTTTVTVERAKVGYMGVAPGSLDEDRRQALGLHEDEGVLLRRVTADGPSAKAGLKDGDVLIRIAGRSVGPMNLRRLLSQIGAGETVDVVVIRDDERLTLPVTLGERP